MSASILELVDRADRRLGEARMAAQAGDDGAAMSGIDDARLLLAQVRVAIERPTGEHPKLNKDGSVAG